MIKGTLRIFEITHIPFNSRLVIHRSLMRHVKCPVHGTFKRTFCSSRLILSNKSDLVLTPPSSRNDRIPPAKEEQKAIEEALDQEIYPEAVESTVEEQESEFLTTIFDDVEPFLDTYDVYLKLREAGFTGPQCDNIIDLIIVQLNSKLSKLSTKFSQVYELENEQYLFESAQQELRVDITRSREQHIHELIALIHSLERDFSTITDELNSDFIQMRNDTQVAMNDQKSENTLLSKQIMLKIQETNHKITTELNSAMRSEIESLRWYLSRWGIIAIMVSLFAACTTFYITKTKQAKRQATTDFAPLIIFEPSEYDEDDYHTDLDASVIAD